MTVEEKLKYQEGQAVASQISNLYGGDGPRRSRGPSTATAIIGSFFKSTGGADSPQSPPMELNQVVSITNPRESISSQPRSSLTPNDALLTQQSFHGDKKKVQKALAEITVMAITITASLIRKLSNFFYWHATVMIVLFVSVYIGFYRIGYDQATVYPTLPAKTGFYIHVIAGSIVYFAGLLQFSSTIRQKHRTFHKACGLTYLSMTLVTYLSLIPIVIGGSQFGISSWLIVMLNGPLWMWTLWLSYKAIKRGDVTEHWKMNLRAFG
ncbi:hypothetical protein HDU99_009196, partial [Rhizoclosmatium hyalinum]